MNDRELLEMAARASGYIIVSYTEDGAWVYINGSPLNSDGEPPIFLWRPRVDDGDALRLAVKLQIQPTIDDVKCHANWWVRPTMTELDSVTELITDEPCSSTRRAINRAAAEIGAAMQRTEVK